MLKHQLLLGLCDVHSPGEGLRYEGEQVMGIDIWCGP